MNPESVPQNNLNQPNTPSASGNAEVTSLPEETKKKEEVKSVLKQIRTFQGDVAEALGKQKESLYSIQQAEIAKAKEVAEKAPEAQKETKEEPRLERGPGTALLVLGTLILLALGGGVGWYAYMEADRQLMAPPVATPESRFFSTTHSVEVDATHLNRETLLGSFSEIVARGSTAEEIIHINLRNKTLIDEVRSSDSELSIEKLFSILGTSAPGNLVRAFEPTFMAGALGGEPGSIFLIIKLSSFENAFGGMLEWEKSMKDDVGALFNNRGLLSGVPFNAQFEDITTRNKDARILKSANGETVLLYSFYDTNTLIITDKEDSLRSLVSRLNNALLSR